MEEGKRRSLPVRFSVFEADLESGELRRQGSKVKLQDQPFQVLRMLLERPGEVVTREEIQKELWTADTFVDFERGLNRAINKLREALLDDAETPRFIETVPRRGYRFLAPVQTEARAGEGNVRSEVSIVQDGMPPPAAVAVKPGRRLLPWMLVATLGAVAGAASSWFWQPRRAAVDRPFLQLDLEAGSDEFGQPAISRDGMRIVFVSKDGLATRRLDQTKTVPLAGTADALFPFFSPNGEWIGFFDKGKLQKIAVAGGATFTLCDAPNAGGATWITNDSIVVSLDLSGRLFRVPAAGGEPQVFMNGKENSLIHLRPEALPGERGVLFAATSASGHGSLMVLPNGGNPRKLVDNATDGRVLPSGYLIYYQGETLFAAPFNLDRLALTGPAVPVVREVANTGSRPDFDVSASGTLVYRHGVIRNNLPYWLYSSGKAEPVISHAGRFLSPRLSPDGKRLAVAEIAENRQNIWIYDLSKGSRYPLTSDHEPELLPTWTPDGEFIAFRAGNSLAWTQSDGSGRVNRLAGVSENAGPWSFSPDGKWLTFWPVQPDSDLWIVPVERAPGEMRLGRPQPLLEHSGSQGAPAISPDGRWLAYSSSETGLFEVFVTPFSPHQKAIRRKWLVSNGGGHSPIWSHSGHELFYETFGGEVHATTYKVRQDSFATERPRRWPGRQLADIGFFPMFEVAPDGKRVLALLPTGEEKAETVLHVLLNVDKELGRRAPAR